MRDVPGREGAGDHRVAQSVTGALGVEGVAGDHSEPRGSFILHDPHVALIDDFDIRDTVDERPAVGALHAQKIAALRLPEEDERAAGAISDHAVARLTWQRRAGLVHRRGNFVRRRLAGDDERAQTLGRNGEPRDRPGVRPRPGRGPGLTGEGSLPSVVEHELLRRAPRVDAEDLPAELQRTDER